MRILWEHDTRRLFLDFDDVEALVSFRKTVRENHGFLVPLPVELALYSEAAVELRVDGESTLELEASVAQVFESASGSNETAFVVETLPEIPSSSESAGDETETRGTAPIFRIKRMNPNEKARLATRAGRHERQVLLRDSSPTVLQSLLANPRLEGKEVLRIVKSTHANAGLLKRIAEDGRWGKNQEILASVAKNPKTPPPLAVRLVDRLRTSDLRLMGKMSSGLREDVRRAALRAYLQRSGSSR